MPNLGREKGINIMATEHKVLSVSAKSVDMSTGPGVELTIDGKVMVFDYTDWLRIYKTVAQINSVNAGRKMAGRKWTRVEVK